MGNRKKGPCLQKVVIQNIFCAYIVSAVLLKILFAMVSYITMANSFVWLNAFICHTALYGFGTDSTLGE